MKTIALILCCLLWLQVIVAADDIGEAHSALRYARETGSRLAYVRARMLYRKYKAKPVDVDLSAYGLRSNLFGGSPVLDDTHSRMVRFVTGGRAIDETLQLDTIRARRSNPEKRTVSIADVESLKIKSHPWAKMLAELPENHAVDPILGLVPHDHFAVYFQRGGDIRVIESTLAQVDSLSRLLALPVPREASRKVLDRLGLKSLSSEGRVVFLSEDLDFYPSTHYALITTDKVPKTERSGKVGDYWVAATSPQLFQRIRTVATGGHLSLAQSLDFQYANSVIDHPRDGIVYLSEAFILKMVSPAYRINSARRAAAIESLVASQYIVWAYRSITGEWPRSLEQIHSEGLIDSPQDAAEVHRDGRVRDTDWGGLYNLKPLSDVPIDRVTTEEKELYDTFRERYQEYWSNFFDPVGVGIRVGETLSFHTIILPLIESSDYNQLAEFTSGRTIVFDSLRWPFQSTPVSLHSRINYEDLILRGFLGRSRDDEVSREARKAEVNRELNRHISGGEPLDLFTFFGNEACLFSLDSDSEFDPAELAGLAIELGDKDAFRRCIAYIGSEIEARSHHQQTYHAVPFMFGSYIYATYAGDFLCLTSGEQAMKNLCQLLADESEKRIGVFNGLDEVGDGHHVLLRCDFSRSNLLGNAFAEWARSDGIRKLFRYKTGYLGDRYELKLALRGTTQKVDDLLLPVSADLLGVPFESEGAKISFGGVPLNGILTNKYVQTGQSRISVEAILAELGAWEEISQSVAGLKWLTATLDFTPEGLSTHLVFKLTKPSSTWFGRKEYSGYRGS